MKRNLILSAVLIALPAAASAGGYVAPLMPAPLIEAAAAEPSRWQWLMAIPLIALLVADSGGGGTPAPKKPDVPSVPEIDAAKGATAVGAIAAALAMIWERVRA